MKRSEINNIMRDCKTFLAEMNFLLPPFATWTPEEWKSKGPECSEIIEAQLGWDITDFGKGDYEKYGLFLFTIRNGTFEELAKKQGKVYAEKIMIAGENQLTPIHLHEQKMEDIINRGGGDLAMKLWNATDGDDLDDTDVILQFDGVQRTVTPGVTIYLKPGESVCLPQRIFHNFWGADGTGPVMIGEVSRVNDDRVDNTFYEPVGRFPVIEEDEPPLHLLYGDYDTYYMKDGE